MLLIDTLVSSADGSGRAQAIPDASCIAANDDGSLTPLIFVELMAQTYAAVKGWEITHAGKEFPIGYLVGVQKFEAITPGMIEEKLVIDVTTIGEFEGFAVVEGTVSKDRTVLAQGKIKLWVPQKEDGES